jgi:ribosomal subunit interface protein
MATTTIKAVNIELTPDIRDYIEKRTSSFDKFFHRYNDSAIVNVEVGKNTLHHKNGDVYQAEITISGIGTTMRAVSEEADLYSAIDIAKESMMQDLSTQKDRSVTLFRRGARSVKKMLKGLSRRNPFTSKTTMQ